MWPWNWEHPGNYRVTWVNRFAVAAANGDAVACAVTNNGPFGIGRTASGMGITLARSPDDPVSGLAPAFLAPVIGVAPDQATIAYVAASGGGRLRFPAYSRSHVNCSPIMEAVWSMPSTPPPQGPHPLVNAISCPAGFVGAVGRLSGGCRPGWGQG